MPIPGSPTSANAAERPLSSSESASANAPRVSAGPTRCWPLETTSARREHTPVTPACEPGCSMDVGPSTRCQAAPCPASCYTTATRRTNRCGVRRVQSHNGCQAPRLMSGHGLASAGRTPRAAPGRPEHSPPPRRPAGQVIASDWPVTSSLSLRRARRPARGRASPPRGIGPCRDPAWSGSLGTSVTRRIGDTLFAMTACRAQKRPLCRTFVWAGEDSNLRPTDYESAALTAELPARRAGFRDLSCPRWSTDGQRESRSRSS